MTLLLKISQALARTVFGGVIGVVVGAAAALVFGRMAGAVACLAGVCFYAGAMITMTALFYFVPGGLLGGSVAGFWWPTLHPRRSPPR